MADRLKKVLKALVDSPAADIQAMVDALEGAAPSNEEECE